MLRADGQDRGESKPSFSIATDAESHNEEKDDRQAGQTPDVTGPDPKGYNDDVVCRKLATGIGLPARTGCPTEAKEKAAGRQYGAASSGYRGRGLASAAGRRRTIVTAWASGS